MNPLVVSRKEAAEALGISVWVLDRMIADRLIPVVRFPSTRDGETNRRILVAVSDLEALVAKRREPAR